jgi:hypothetical protein
MLEYLNRFHWAGIAVATRNIAAILRNPIAKHHDTMDP